MKAHGTTGGFTLLELVIAIFRAVLGTERDDLWHLAHGSDDRPVVPGWEPKSIGAETTFDEDCADRDRVLKTLLALSDRVGDEGRDFVPREQGQQCPEDTSSIHGERGDHVEGDETQVHDLDELRETIRVVFNPPQFVP